MEPSRSTVNARVLLLPYTLVLVAAMLSVQLVIAASSGRIGALVGALTAVVAAGIGAWSWRTRSRLRQVRFGGVVAHTIAFVTVTTSFNLHAVIRITALGSGADGFVVAARELLATGWFGATLVMTSLWGLGLLIHLTGAVLGRGWED